MAARFLVTGGGSVTWTNADTSIWSASSGGLTGASVPGASDTVTMDAASGGGTVTLNYAPTVTSITCGAFTGTFDTGNQTITANSFVGSGAGTRTFTFGSSIFNIVGTGTVWNIGTITNLTFTANTATINITGNAVTFTGSALTYGGSINFTGGGACTLSGGNTIASLNYTGVGAADSLAVAQIVVTGTFTVTGSSAVNVTTIKSTAAGTTRLVTIGNGNFTNATFSDISITLDGAGNTWTLNEALTMVVTGANTSALTITAGTFTTANKNITAVTFNSSNSNTRAINLGSSTVTLTGVGTVWSTGTVTALTFAAGTSTITLNNASSSSKTFSGGTLTYNILRLTGAGTGTFIIGTNANATTISSFIVDTAPHTVQVFAGKTLTVSSVTWSGTASSLNTFQSTTNGVAWNLVDASGTDAVNYVSLQDSHASGGASFYAGNHSTNVSGNTGWIFTQPVPSTQNAARDENTSPTLLGVADANGTTPIRAYADPLNNALMVNDSTDGTDNGGGINAAHDQNSIPVWIAVSSSDGTTPVEIYVDSVTHELLVTSV